MTYASGHFVGSLAGAAFGSLIAALVVQLATKLVAKFKPPYGMAYKAAFLGFVASLIVGYLLSFFGVYLNAFSVTSIVIGFFISSAIYASIIKHPETGPIGFGKATLVCLIQLVIVGIPIAVYVLTVNAIVR